MAPRPFNECLSKHGPHTKCQLKLPNNLKPIPFCNKHIGISGLIEKVDVISHGYLQRDQFEIALEEDDTIVDDDDYLECLEDGTKFKILKVDATCDEADGVERADKASGSSESPSPPRTKKHKSNTSEENPSVTRAKRNKNGNEEIEEKDRKIFELIVKKLKGNLGSVMVLSQEQLMVLHETDEKKLESRFNITAKDADKLKWLAFDIYRKNEEDEDNINYMDLVKRASDWEKQQESQDFDSEESSLQFDGYVEADGMSHDIDSSFTEKYKQLDKDELIERLKPKLMDDLVALINLKEEEYMLLLEGDFLKQLDIPEKSFNDAMRFCREKQESLKRKRCLRKLLDIPELSA